MARKRSQTTRYGPPNQSGRTKQDVPAFGGDFTRSSTYYRAQAAETYPTSSQTIRNIYRKPGPLVRAYETSGPPDLKQSHWKNLPHLNPPKDYTNTHGGVGRPRAPAPQRGGGTNTVHRKIIMIPGTGGTKPKPKPKAPPAGRRYQ